MCDGSWVRDENGRLVCGSCGSLGQEDLFACIRFGDRVFGTEGGLFVRHRDGTSVFRDGHLDDQGRQRLDEMREVMVL